MQENKSSSADVTILMSTYNGEKYIRQQLESIIEQAYDSWILLVRDDGSTDGTLKTLSEISKSDSRIRVLGSDGFNLGASKSFLKLLCEVNTPYFMLCDQDDFWLPNKIFDSIEQLKKYNGPHLVCSDLQVVDEELSVLSESFMRRRQLNAKSGFAFKKLLMQNIVVGCTVAGNRALLDVFKSRVISASNIVMHDWWLALIASAFGKITYMEKSLILYRQHGQNCVGAKPSGIGFYLDHLLYGKPFAKTWRYLDFTSMQACEFYSQYGMLLSEKQKKQIVLFLNVREKNVFVSLLRCFFRGVSMHSLKRNLSLLICFVFVGMLPSTNKVV